MSNTLIVHIGTPKTGTTALQKFLADNGEQLKKRGWCYPNLGRDWRIVNNASLAGGIPKNGNLIKFSVTQQWKKWEKDFLWKIIKSYLEHYNVILSDEGLYLCFEAAMQEIRARHDNVKIICYLRRQDLYIESKWNQTVKEVFYGEDAETLHNVKQEELDYRKRLERLVEIFGKENVIVRIYEKGQFGGVRGDITSDFLEACGIDSDWDEVKLPGYVNERIDNDVLGLKCLFNKAYSDEIKKLEINPPGEVIKRHFWGMKLKGENTKSGYVSKKFRKEVLEKFEKDNEYIAREFLGREDGILFYDQNIDIPRYSPAFSEREEKMVSLFASILAENAKKQLDLEKQLLNQTAAKAPQGMKDSVRRIRMNLAFQKLNFK